MTREEIIDGLEIYTAGRLNRDRIHITVKELQKFIDEIKALEKEHILDKIRDDIMKLQKYKMFDGEDTLYVERDDVLAIIDKYKAESEGKE